MPEKDAAARQKEKQKVFDEWMKGDHVFVNVHTKVPGVELPESLLQQVSVNLKLSYLFQGETKCDDSGIITYLKFSGDYNKCVIPWDAIWGMSNEASENRLWPDDMPKEVIVELYTSKFKEIAASLFGKKSRGEEQLETTSKEVDSETSAKKGGHLKLVK